MSFSPKELLAAFEWAQCPMNQKLGPCYLKWCNERGIPNTNFNFKESMAELQKQCEIDAETIQRIKQKIQFYLVKRAEQASIQRAKKG